MFEILANLILASLFLEAQAQSQLTLAGLSPKEQRLPLAAIRTLEQNAPQKKLDSQSLGVEITAPSVLVVDSQSDKVLYEKNPLAAHSIASLTKLMTALVFLDYNPGWAKEVTIENSDYREGGMVYLVVGEKITVRDLFYAALLASANEAAVALARTTVLSEGEFIKAMNNKAKGLGMVESRLVDLTGLSEENQATAVDIIKLMKAALAEPEIFAALSAKEYTIKILNKSIARKVITTDKILGDALAAGNGVSWVEAGKTGYLKSAGYNFISQIRHQNGQRIWSVVLGSATINDRFNDTKSVAYWVFNNYNWQ